MNGCIEIYEYYKLAVKHEEEGNYESAARCYRGVDDAYSEGELPFYDSKLDRMVDLSFLGYRRCLSRMKSKTRKQFIREDYHRAGGTRYYYSNWWKWYDLDLEMMGLKPEKKKA